jgi:hypothetical protein
VGPERGPLGLVSTTEELLGRKSSGSGVENRAYGHRDPLVSLFSISVDLLFAYNKEELHL